MLESGKLAGWTTQPVKRAHSFAWPPSSDEDSSATPPSSPVGPSTPEPLATHEQRKPNAQVRQTAGHDNQVPAHVEDLIDFGPADCSGLGDPYDGLQPPLQPDTKEVNLVSCLIDA